MIRCSAWEDAFHRFMETTHPDILRDIAAEKSLSDETMAALQQAVEEFKQVAVV